MWNLTGGTVHITDAGNASRTLLYNIRQQCWDEDLRQLMTIPASLLPQVRSSSAVYAAARLPELAHDIPIAGIAGDQQAALFGQMCLQPARNSAMGCRNRRPWPARHHTPETQCLPGPPGAALVDGGATANNTLMQFQADMLQIPIVRPRILETTALGAAYLAGLATGFWKDTGETSKQWQKDRRVEPPMPATQAAERLQECQTAAEKSKAWAD